jgi:hypothetical protein
MILLVFVSIYIFKKFKELALAKGYTPNKWGTIGVITYLSIGLGGQLLLGVLLGIFDPYTIENIKGISEIFIAILFYALGGLACFIIYERLKNKPNLFAKDIDNFGKEETEKN